MPDLSIRIRQTVQVTSYCSQEVAIGISGLPEDASDEYIQSLMNGVVRRGFAHLSKAVLEKCDELRSREEKRMRQETNGN